MDQIKVYEGEDSTFFFAKPGVNPPPGFKYYFTAGNIADATTLAGASALAENGRHYGSEDSAEFVYKKLVNVKDFEMEIAAFQIGEELKKMLVVN